ncbi:MAG: hypothetical protein HY818_14605 [Acetobacterium woodii]|nr:hypothetical protein [Acetobacterium woodii]
MNGQKNKIRKTIGVYAILSLVAIGINFIYGQFGHGVHSAAMTWMFLYPLLGGALFYFLLERLKSGMTRFAPFRFGYNSYNSGIATLTVGSFLKGILEIAGTNSPYLVLFTIIGWLFIAVGVMVFALLSVSRKKNSAPQKEAPDYHSVIE